MPRNESADALLPLADAAFAAGEFGARLWGLNCDLRATDPKLLAAVLGAAIGVAAILSLVVGSEGAVLNKDAIIGLHFMSATQLANATGQPVALHLGHLDALSTQLAALGKEYYVTSDEHRLREMWMRAFGRWTIERTSLFSFGDDFCVVLGGAVMICAKRLVDCWRSDSEALKELFELRAQL